MEKETKIILWNCRSLSAKLSRLKMLIYSVKPHIVCLTETWTSAGAEPSFINYRAYWWHRVGKTGGGTAVLVRNDVAVLDSSLNLYREGLLEVQKVKVIMRGKKTDILNAYNPNHNISTEELMYYFNQLEESKIIIGDFNGHHEMWTSRRNNNTTGNNLVNALSHFPEVALATPINFPTYLNPANMEQSTLDLCFIPVCLTLDVDMKQLTDLGSDHIPILMTMGCMVDCTSFRARPRYKLSSGNWDVWKNQLSPVTFKSELQEEYECFIKCINEAAEKSFTKTKEIINPKYNKPWWTKECQEAVRSKKRAKNTFKSHPTYENLIALRRSEAIVRRCCKEAKKLSWQNYCSTITSRTEAKKVWDKIRKLTNKTIRTNNPICIDDSIITDSKTKGEIIAEKFKETMNTKPPNRDTTSLLIPIAVATSDMEDSTYDRDFTKFELNYVLGKLKNTSAGKDLVHNKFLKNLPEEYKDWLLRIINRSYSECTIPYQWKEALIIPVLKPNKPSASPSSYRPISLLSSTAKVMEKLVSARLEHQIESGQSLISNTQSGFRKKMCTLDQVSRLENEIRKTFANKSICMVVYFDLTSAYDMVWHMGLVYKLAECGVKNRMLRWIQKYLTGRNFTVYLDGDYSSIKHITSGVPQGSSLSPLLFNIIMRDIPKEDNVTYSEYADDVAIYATSNNVDDLVKTMQRAINKFYAWTVDWGLKINLQKTKGQIFTNKKYFIPNLKICNIPIQFESTQKFLGVTMDAPKLNWTGHIESLRTKTIPRINILSSVSNFHWGADRETLQRLYIMLIRSQLDYGAIFYDTASEKALGKLDVVQNTALRIICGARKTSPIEAIQVETNVPPLYLHRRNLILKYFHRVAELPKEAPIVRDTFSTRDMMRSLNWNKTIKPPVFIKAENYLRALGLSYNASIHGKMACPFYPWENIEESVSHEFMNYKVANLQQPMVGQIFCELKERKYGGFLEIYTDGSYGVGCDQSMAAAAAYVVPELKEEYSIRLAPHFGVLGAELLAIYKVLTWLRTKASIVGRYPGVVIYTDSKSSVSLISERFPKSHSFYVQNIQEMISRNNRSGLITHIQWIPGHKGIIGNEMADNLAKAGLSRDTSLLIPCPREGMNKLIKTALIKEWQNRWTPRDRPNCTQEKTHLKLIKQRISYWPWVNHSSRTIETTLARLRLGHARVAKYLFRFKLADSNLCPCGQIESVEHLLLHCQLHRIQRRVLVSRLTNWQVSPTLQNILGGGDFDQQIQRNIINAVAAYLRSIRKLHQL